MTSHLDALIQSLISPNAQPIPAVDLGIYADPGPSKTKGQSDPRENRDVGISSTEMQQMIKDIVAGEPNIRPSSPYAAEVLKKLRKNIADMPRGAIVEIPVD